MTSASAQGGSGAAASHTLALSESNRPLWLGLMVVFGLLFIASYYAILGGLWGQWHRIADYTHGYLVIPMTLAFLWLRRDEMPKPASGISLLGLIPILVAALLRFVGSYYYLEALHGWSIPFWVTGFVWIFFGWQVCKWALPAIAFLIFMVPIPFTLEHMLSQPLQQISTQISVFILQFLQQPAVAQGTTILLGSEVLEVERACSGLRIFFGIAATAYVFILLFKRPIWSNLLLILAVLPIALISNSIRIVVTGLAIQMGLGELANTLSHDLAGFFMILLAAVLFGLTLKYLDHLFPDVTTVDADILVRKQASKPSSS